MSDEASRHPIRVAYVIDKLGLGGAQTHLGGLVSGLGEGYSPTVFHLIAGGRIADDLQRRGVPLIGLGVPRLYGTRAPRALRVLVRCLRQNRTDIVHTYLSSANVFGAVAARLAGVPCLITSRRDTGFGDSPTMRLALRHTNRWASRVVAVSQDVAEVVLRREKVDPRRLTVIPNGIDLSRFQARGRRRETRKALGLEDDTPLILAVGHVTRVKGVDVLLEAAARLVRERPGAVFLVAGDGHADEVRRVEDQVAEAGLRHAFRLLGARTDVPDLLEACDIFVQPSRSEGQPNAVMEAMAMGVPVVATRVGGVPEIARDGAEAVLVPAEDPERLAEACSKLLVDDDRRRRLGAAAAARARAEFGLDTMVGRYVRMYQAAAAPRASAPRG